MRRDSDELYSEVRRLIMVRDERLRPRSPTQDIDAMIRVLLMDVNEDEIRTSFMSEGEIEAGIRALHWKDGKDGVDPPSAEWSQWLIGTAA